ncbi:uncharacterized protein LOC143566572 [Bidens hawaiensis]|uniref:uncharacterized protein LOC143566572 n=1 Tax=Bidens hawaiensis TaxID=980011 RepID=UPI00404AA3E5
MGMEWNGLQALVHKDSPYASFVHCFAHRLQLTLVASSREVVPDELQKPKTKEIKELIELSEIKMGKGLNQVGTLRRAGDTHWSSHYQFVCSMIDMFDCTRIILQGIIDEPLTTFTQRADADAGYVNLKSFDFVFILHLIKEVIGRTEILSYSLQKKPQDILNAIELVKATKDDLNDFRNNKWDSFLTDVTFFYLFKATVDKQLHELNARFNDQTMELLNLSSTLVSKKDPEVIDVDQICLLDEKYYPQDFTEQERIQLRSGSVNFDSSGFYRNNREGILALKIFKNRLHNKMSKDYLANNLAIYIEKELAESFDSTSPPKCLWNPHAGNPIPTPPKKKNVNLKMILQLQEMAQELTKMLIQNEQRVLDLHETVEEMNTKLQDINEQIQIQSIWLGFFPPPPPPPSFGGGNPFGGTLPGGGGFGDPFSNLL